MMIMMIIMMISDLGSSDQRSGGQYSRTFGWRLTEVRVLVMVIADNRLADSSTDEENE